MICNTKAVRAVTERPEEFHVLPHLGNVR